jgi:hypothetical protein
MALLRWNTGGPTSIAFSSAVVPSSNTSPRRNKSVIVSRLMGRLCHAATIEVISTFCCSPATRARQHHQSLIAIFDFLLAFANEILAVVSVSPSNP